MFFRIYKYSLLCSTRDRLMVFWNLVFPIILGSLFQVAFGNYTEKEVPSAPSSFTYATGIW